MGIKSVWIVAFVALAQPAHAMDGIAVTTHWTGTNHNLYGGYGEIWRHDITHNKAVKHTKLHSGPARAVVISPDGTHVAFIAQSGAIQVMSTSGGAVKNLATTRPEAHLDWPRGDWIYYNLGGFEEPARSRVLRRVNAATQKDEAVVSWTHGVWRFFISADVTRAVLRTDDTPPEPYGRIVAYDMLRDAGELDLARSTERFSCSTGLDPEGEVFLRGNTPHDGVEIRPWNDVTKILYAFTHAEAEAWGGPPSGTQHNRNNWSANSSDWFCVHLGFGKRGATGANQVLYNWVDKERIVVTNNAEGSYAFDSAGDFWVEGRTIVDPPLDPPHIDAHPASVTITEGGDVSFSVRASGSDPLSYQWQRGGQDIASATVASYELEDASLSDDGATFRCVVTNPAGVIASSAATLRVTSRPAENTAPTVVAGGDRVATVGSALLLSGVVQDDGLPSSALTYAWTQVSGPDALQIETADALETLMVFTSVGAFVLRLSVSDGDLIGADALVVRVTEDQLLEVTRPVGGEVFIVGSHENLQWKGTGVAQVRLEVTLDDGLSWLPITAVNSDSMDWGRLSWAVPEHPSTRCRVAVVSGDLRAESAQTFEIRAAPIDDPVDDLGVEAPKDGGAVGLDAGAAVKVTAGGENSLLVGGCQVGGSSSGVALGLLGLFWLLRRRL
ncbi:MAG: immunoglobulin domain-containing protein [Deltaproteobacteria bacterium]|nr:immunoglobulin domain-containing protein [Deltaproteobacteria bacterium]